MKELILKTELEKVGFTGSKAEMIESAFAPMVEMLKGFEAEFEEITNLEINAATTIKARELRLKLVKVRTTTAKVHKEQKDEYLRGGRAIDGIKNILEFAVVDKENALEKIEKHFENIEKERLQTLKTERNELVSPYGIDGYNLSLELMSEEVFNNFLSGSKLAFEQKIEAERLAEQKRIAEIEAEKQRQIERDAELERLRLEREAREKEIAEERKQAELKRLEAEKESKRIQAEKDEQLRLEREAREKAENEIRLANELKAKKEKEAEELRIAEEKAKLKAEKEAQKAPDKQKLKQAIESCELSKVDLKQSESVAVYSLINAKFESFKKWANEQIETI